MVLARIIVKGIEVGARYLPKTVQALKRTDVRIHKSLYGASGGRGVRHGRDIGSTIGGLYSGFTQEGDELDSPANDIGTPFKTRQFNQTRNRRIRFNDPRFAKRCRPCKGDRQSRPRY